MQEIRTKLRSLLGIGEYRFVLAALEGKSFVEAGRILGCDDVTVNRNVTAIEKRLGVKLFVRQRQGVTPRDELLKIKDDIESLARSATAIERKLATLDREPTGEVHIVCTDGMHAYWIAPRLARLYEQYPGITLTIETRESMPSLETGEADVWIGYTSPGQRKLVSFDLGAITFVLVASQGYLDQHGRPEKWDDLDKHWLCTHMRYSSHAEGDSDWARWDHLVSTSQRVRLRSDLSMGLLAATRNGVGISLQPENVLTEYPELQAIDLDGYEITATFKAVFHEDLRDIPRFRATIDSLKTIMEDAGLRGRQSRRRNR